MANEGGPAHGRANVLRQLGVSENNIARVSEIPKPGVVGRMMNGVRGSVRAAGFASIVALASACGDVAVGCGGGFTAGEHGVNIGAGGGAAHINDEGRVRGVGVGVGGGTFDIDARQVAGQAIELTVDDQGRMVQTGGPRVTNVPQAREQSGGGDSRDVVERPGNRSPVGRDGRNPDIDSLFD